MKRAKRDASQRAYRLGYRQGFRGHAKQGCPFFGNLDRRAEWLAGWRHGHADYLSGYRRGLLEE